MGSHGRIPDDTLKFVSHISLCLPVHGHMMCSFIQPQCIPRLGFDVYLYQMYFVISC